MGVISSASSRLKARFLTLALLSPFKTGVWVSTLNPEEFEHMCGRGWECGVALLGCLMSLCNAPSVCGSVVLYPGWLLTFWFPGFCYKLSFSSLTPTFPSHSLCPSLPTHFPYPPLVKPLRLVTVSPSTLSLMGNVLFFVNILSPSTHIL